MSARGLSCLFTVMALLVFSVTAHGQGMTGPSTGQNVADMRFVPFPGLPTCAVGSVQNGDPTKGASIIFAKIEVGCSIPWHWHTPNENLMMVSGMGLLETKDGKAFTLLPGGYAMMPSRHIHQFRCEQACLLYIYSDTVFDIHYVNTQGNEIRPADALATVGETAMTETK